MKSEIHMFYIVCMSTYFHKSFFFFLFWPVGRAHAARLEMAAVIVMAPRQIKEDAAGFDEVHHKCFNIL